MTRSRRRRTGIPIIVAALLLAGCQGTGATSAGVKARAPDAAAGPAVPAPPPGPVPGQAVLDVYRNDRPGNLSPVVASMPTRLYVPNSDESTVDEIDPSTGKVVRHFPTGKLPQHVVPAWDLKTLYVANDLGNSLTPIDPTTGEPGTPIPVDDPYNVYFTPDGRSALVVAERLARLDFRDPHTFALQRSVGVPCKGVDHLDFSADGSYLIASCEFAGTVVKVRLDGPDGPRVEGAPLPLRPKAQPQDVKLSPDGTVFYVADMVSGGVWVLDGEHLGVLGFLPTANGAHGLYVSRDSSSLYVSNRAASSISVIDLPTRTVRTTWKLPGNASPDMGGVSADGGTLWVSGRTSREIYGIDTTSGQLTARIPVGRGPHGLCVYPQPGTYSLGHTGIFR
ncbi:MAG: beta-propeller fold lactonase family protein [Acidimicrobiales bacterium]